MNYERVASNIRKELKRYLQEHHLKSVVLGVSGGVDSALSAALARPVCLELNIPLIGRSLPIKTNKEDEISRAREIGAAFCSDFKEVDLAPIFESIAGLVRDVEGQVKDQTRDKIREGNIKARCRMVYLYNLAFMNQGLVLSSDNRTELLLGFWTLHGDVGDVGTIQELYKSEVYGLARYLAECGEWESGKAPLMACVNAVPTDGLGITNSDLDQIKAKSYDEVDNILINWLEARPGYEYLKDHPVIQRYEGTHFKRNNPYNFSRALLMNFKNPL